MNKKLVLSGLVFGETLFGEGVSETTYSENSENSFNKNEMMKGNSYQKNKKNGGMFIKLKQFMDQDLTDQEKEELKEVFQIHRNLAKELFVDYEPELGEKLDQGTKEEMKQKFKELRESFFQDLEEYVDDERMQDYQEFIEKSFEIDFNSFYRRNKKFGPLMKFKYFLKQNLTDQQKEELREIMQTHKNYIKEVYEENNSKNGEELDEIAKDEIKDLKEVFFQELEEFVDDDKMQEYHEFVEKELERGIQTTRVNRKEIYNKKRKYVVGSVAAPINQKLNSITQN